MKKLSISTIAAALFGLGILAFSTACVVPVYEYDGYGHRHYRQREWRDHDEHRDWDHHRP